MPPNKPFFLEVSDHIHKKIDRFTFRDLCEHFRVSKRKNPRAYRVIQSQLLNMQRRKEIEIVDRLGHINLYKFICNKKVKPHLKEHKVSWERDFRLSKEITLKLLERMTKEELIDFIINKL